MTDEQFKQYSADPKGMDETVRTWFKLPPDRYYTISIWPVPGIVRVNSTLHREVKLKKISKSTQA